MTAVDECCEFLCEVDGLVLELCVSDVVEPCDLDCELVCDFSELYVSDVAWLLEAVAGLEICDVSWF